ncbi:MAG: aldose 1-epimerase family protein [Micrococcales bacterium]
MNSATGQQFSLNYVSVNNQWKATISEIGAAIRELSVNGIELVQGWHIEDYPQYCPGVVMAPWANRIDGGRWTYQGRVRQFDLNIVSQQNSNHGLLLNWPYKVVEQTESAVTLSATIFPRDAYPFLVETTVRYELTETGLVVTHSAVNRSADPAPYGVGGHPYFKFSKVDTGDLTLTLSAKSYLPTDDRQIPTGIDPVAGTRFDLTRGGLIRDNFIDQDYTDLEFGSDGLAHTTLTTAGGEGIDVWQDSNFKHVVIFTPSFFPTRDGEVFAAAIEPATLGPNAFNTGNDLMWLETDKSWSGSWGVSLVK